MKRANNFIDLTGQKFGKLTVIKLSSKSKYKYLYWECICDCGNKKDIAGKHLRNMTTKSCGCLSVESIKSRSTTHGMTESIEYKTWCGIKRRCNNKSDKRYPSYGGRGIKVCESWNNSFESFFADMGTRPSKNHSIERIDNNKNYSPNNCKWINNQEQAKNRRSNINLTMNNKTLILSEWAKLTGIKAGTISARLRCGWTVSEALSIPTGQPRNCQSVPSK